MADPSKWPNGHEEGPGLRDDGCEDENSNGQGDRAHVEVDVESQGNSGL